ADLVAGQDRALDRRRAAPAGEERGVDVDAAHFRGIEDRLWKDQTVGGDHRQVGLQGTKALLLLLAAKGLGRPDLDPELLGPLVHRRLAIRFAAPGRPRWLAVGSDHLMLPRNEGIEARHGEVGRSHEDDAQLTTSVRPELVEGPSYLGRALNKGRGFDKLSPNGMGEQWPARRSKHCPRRSPVSPGSGRARRGVPCST